MAKAEFQADKWEKSYNFLVDGEVVVIRHHLNKNIRSDENGAGIDGDGAFGKRSQWKVHLSGKNDEVVIKLQNCQTGDFLRIMKNGDKINGGGKGQGLCDFKVDRVSKLVVKLESVAAPGAYVAVSKDGVIVGKGGPHCRVQLLGQGAFRPFPKPYRFYKKDTVLIQHSPNNSVRVIANNMGEVDGEGRHDKDAQWIAIPSKDGKECLGPPQGDVVQFKSVRTGDYLRVRADGEVDARGKGKELTFFKVHQVEAVNEVRLESQKFEGKFLEFNRKDKKLFGGDNKNRNSIFHIFIETLEHNRRKGTAKKAGHLSGGAPPPKKMR